MLVTKQKPNIEYLTVEKFRSPEGLLHRFVNIRASNLPEDAPEFALDIGMLAVKAIVNLTPQPIGDHFSVVWDGNKLAPTLRFDGHPDVANIRVEVWGKGGG